MFCHHCGSRVESKDKIGRQEACPKCGSYLHCCLNCRFYNEAAYHQCRETQAEWVTDKKMGNYCEYFEPSDKEPAGRTDKAEEARQKLDQLFKKK